MRLHGRIAFLSSEDVDQLRRGVSIVMYTIKDLDGQIKKLIRLYRTHQRIRRVSESFDNINRMKPVRLNVAGSSGGKKRKQADTISTDSVSIPTEAEMDFKVAGLQLPSKSENLGKLLADLNRTGKFDYELCYLLRKQETLEELKGWIATVMHRRKMGDQDFGIESDPLRFNHLAESSMQRIGRCNLFRESFMASLKND